VDLLAFKDKNKPTVSIRTQMWHAVHIGFEDVIGKHFHHKENMSEVEENVHLSLMIIHTTAY